MVCPLRVDLQVDLGPQPIPLSLLPHSLPREGGAFVCLIVGFGFLFCFAFYFDAGFPVTKAGLRFACVGEWS